MKRNLLKTVLVAAACFLGAAQGWAETEVVKSWDLAAISKAQSEDVKLSTMCDGTINARRDNTTVSCSLCTGSLDGLFAEGADKWLLRPKQGGLYNGNGGPRVFGITNLKAGDIVTISYAPGDNGGGFGDVTNASSELVDNTYTWNVTNDGVVYSALTRYAYIYSVTVEREKSDKPFDPTGKITAVNGVNRTITLSTESLDCEIYYTTDGTEPTTASTLYTEAGVVISETTTIKAIAVKDGVASDVYTAEFAAGKEVAVNAPSCTIVTLLGEDPVYYAKYEATSDNSSVLCKPTSTLTATFNGTAVTLPFEASEVGTLVVTAAADGYASASTEVEVKAYAKTLYYDFKYLTAEDLNSEIWGKAQVGLLGAENKQWNTTQGGMTAETVHYTIQSDEALSTAFPGLTLGKLKTDMPSLYIGYGIIWGSTATHYGSVTITDGNGDEIIGVTTNGSYGTNRSTWYTEGKTVQIYRFDTALENLAVYAPIDLTPATVTLAVDGWKAFSCDRPLDFTGTDIKAYIAKELDAANASVILEEVDGVVPANTGLMVKGTAGTYTVNVSVEAAADVTGNLLVAAPADTEIDGTASNDIYVYGSYNGGDRAFYHLGTVLTPTEAVSYLKVGTASAKPARIVIKGEESTGIEAIEAEAAEGAAYNFAGQRVYNANKGMFIINGKKVMK